MLVHASCWIPSERPLARLVPYNAAHRLAVEAVRQQLWDLDQDLKAYRARPDPTSKAALAARLELLVNQPSD
jgi:hypothetical protein